jgi:5'-nucleotidase
MVLPSQAEVCDPQRGGGETLPDPFPLSFLSGHEEGLRGAGEFRASSLVAQSICVLLLITKEREKLMSRKARRTLVTLLTFAILVTAILLLPVSPVAADKNTFVEVQILALNDFHGNLLPPLGSSGRIGSIDAGGVEYLSTHLNELRSANPNTVFVSAGDMIGASPLLSALFHDEPTIEAFNTMGLDLNAVGNHEFDEGAQELLRMQEGGCHPVDGCQDGDDFAGADFDYLAANVVWEDTGETLFPAYKIFEFEGVKVAFIGMTLEGTPTIVTPSGVAGLDFLDEADTVNALIKELKNKGVKTIVVLIHEGGFPAGGFNECPGISGPIVDIVNRTHGQVDLFITGHTHQAYNCVINERPVTSAASFGRLITDIDMVLNPRSGQPISITANNNIVTRDVPKDSLLTALIDKYNAFAAPLANRIIGSITADITRAANAAGESALGDVIADAQLHATAPAGFGEAVVAFMNPGGIRADLTYASSPVGEGDGNVTYGEAFTVQPFGNSLVTMTLTGAQIDTLLEQQFDNPAPGSSRILQVSNGFTYSWSASAPTGNKVDPATIQINGVTVDPSANYRVTVNSFLADGGDNFSVLVQGTDRLGGDVDTDALEAYFDEFSPVMPGPQNRITQVP